MMEKLKSILKFENFYQYLLVFFITLLLTLWFKDGLLIASGEDGPFLLNAEKSLIIFDNLWIENGTGFSTTDFLPRLPFAYFAYSLSFLGFPPFLIQAITFFILMITGCISVYKLVHYLNKKSAYVRELSFFAAFFYLFNPFTLTQLWNRQLYSQYFLFALFPLILYFFIKGLEEKKYEYIFYLSLASLFFSTTFGLITNVVVIWSVLILYSFYFFFTKGERIYLLKFLFISILVWGLTNLWWLIPFYINLQGESLFTNKLNTYENLGTLRALSNYFAFDNLIRLLQDNYFFRDLNLKGFYTNYFLQIFSFIAPLLILLNSYSIYKDKRLRFFVLIFLVGLFVSLGSNFPFGFIFEFLFTKISFLQSFRNPYEKYGIVYMLGFVVLLSYSLLFLLNNLKSKIFIYLFFIFWIYYLSPLLYGERINETKIYYPNKVGALNTKINEITPNDKNYRITSLPLTGEGVSTNWKYSGVEPSLYLYDSPFVSYIVNTPIQLDFLNKLNEKIINGTSFEFQMSLINSRFIYLKDDLVSDTLFTENSITKKKILDLDEIENFNCERISFEKNLIADKKVISCSIKNYQLGESFLLKIESPYNISPIEVNIIDSIGNRNIWREPEQVNNQNLTTTYLINSNKATEKSKIFNYYKIVNINIIVNKNVEVENISLSSFKFFKTPFKLVDNDNSFKRLYSKNNISIYELTEFNQPEEFGYITSIKTAAGLTEIFSLEKISEKLKNTSIVALNQNKNKFFDANLIEYSKQTLDTKKVSPTKYWIENNLSNNNIQNLQLLNTYNSQWILLKDVSLEDLEPGFFNSYNLVQKSRNNTLNSTHILSNGFANFWQIKNSENHKGYTVLFLPQIYKDLFIYISGLFYILLIVLFCLRNFFSNNKD